MECGSEQRFESQSPFPLHIRILFFAVCRHVTLIRTSEPCFFSFVRLGLTYPSGKPPAHFDRRLGPLQGKIFAGIQHSIDNKDATIFTLLGGGTSTTPVRRIYFSVHNRAAQRAAERNAQEKWGRRVKLEGDHIAFPR